MAVFLFPGQGSQRIETLAQFYGESDAARTLLDHARELLPDTVRDVLFCGTQETLDHTINAQPALLIVESAIVAHLKTLDIRPELCVGHSLGEVAALTAAGVLTLEDAIPFVCARARLMSENVPEGGMAAVIGMAAEDIAPLLCDGVQIANYNGPAQTIISGAAAPLQTAAVVLKENGARRILPLKVSGPFHSHLMRPAAEELAAYLERMNISPPAVPFLSSVSGCLENDPGRIRALLAEQLYSPVQWTVVMMRIQERKAVEVGPGNVLAGLAKRTPRGPEVYPADTPASCQALASVL